MNVRHLITVRRPEKDGLGRSHGGGANGRLRCRTMTEGSQRHDELQIEHPDQRGRRAVTESEAGSGPPVGLVLTFAAPRIELSIGVSKVLKFDGVKEAAAKADKYFEFTASTGMSHSGSTVIVPCTRTDVHLTANVGASANGFGQSVGDVQKRILSKDYTKVVPSNNQLCKGL